MQPNWNTIAKLSQMGYDNLLSFEIINFQLRYLYGFL
jgi:hypothetical protein